MKTSCHHQKKSKLNMSKTQFLKILSFFLIIILFGCTDNYYTTADGLGRVNIYIQGDITDAEAATKLASDIGTQTENIYVQNTTQLTTLNIQGKGEMIGIYIEGNSIALSNITINGVPKLNTFKFKYL